MNGMLLTGDATPPALSPRPKVKIEVGPGLCAGESILLPVTSSTSLDVVIYDPSEKMKSMLSFFSCSITEPSL